MEASPYSGNNINLEIKWFLAVLKTYSTQKLQLDAKSLDELAAIVSHIGTLIGDANIVPAGNGPTDNLDFYLGIGDSDHSKYFQIDHLVTCRICHMQIGLSREEIQVHIQSGKHRWNVDSRKSAISQSAAEPYSAETKIDESLPMNNAKRAPKPNIYQNHIGNGVGSNNGTNSPANGIDGDKRDERAVSLADGAHSRLESTNLSTTETADSINDSLISAMVLSEDNDRTERQQIIQMASKTEAPSANEPCSSENLLRMSSQLSAFLERNIPVPVEPVHAAIKKVFARNVDQIVKQELDLSAGKIAIAHRDLSAAVTVAVGMKRKVYLYGSYAYGAPPDKGVINIFFDYDKIHYTSKTVPKQCTAACESLMTYLNASKSWTDVKQIKVFDKKNAVEAKRECNGTLCHFTFDSGIPVAAASLIEHFFKLQPMCHKMVIFIRHWQMTINRDNKNCLPMSGYFLTVLVIFFFQFLNLLPSVYELQNKDGVVNVNYNGFHVQFDTTSRPTPAPASCKTYLHRFFAFYGDLLRTTENFFISPYHGKIICRIEETAKTTSLTAEQNAVNASLKMMRGGNWTDKSIYVQDLFVRCNNIGRDITAEVIKSFQRYCAQSTVVLGQK